MEQQTTRFEEMASILSKKKGLVCKEFEKVCPTKESFNRMVKEMHNIFDGLEADLIELFYNEQE